MYMTQLIIHTLTSKYKNVSETNILPSHSNPRPHMEFPSIHPHDWHGCGKYAPQNYSQRPPPSPHQHVIPPNKYIHLYITTPPTNTTLFTQNHSVFPPYILDTLVNTFQLTHSYFFMPLTCPINITQYHSPHKKYSIFGSFGLTFSNQWKNNGLTHITNLEQNPKTIKWAKLTAQSKPNYT